jgi:hypothetical protein
MLVSPCRYYCVVLCVSCHADVAVAIVCRRLKPLFAIVLCTGSCEGSG